MQRTSEEVQKHKHLMEKGHDVSNQLRSETTSQGREAELIAFSSHMLARLNTKSRTHKLVLSNYYSIDWSRFREFGYTGHHNRSSTHSPERHCGSDR